MGRLETYLRNKRKPVKHTKHIKTKRMATPKQRAYLKDLGFNGTLDAITLNDAQRLIKQLRAKPDVKQYLLWLGYTGDISFVDDKTADTLCIKLRKEIADSLLAFDCVCSVCHRLSFLGHLPLSDKCSVCDGSLKRFVGITSNQIHRLYTHGYNGPVKQLSCDTAIKILSTFTTKLPSKKNKGVTFVCLDCRHACKIERYDLYRAAKPHCPKCGGPIDKRG